MMIPRTWRQLAGKKVRGCGAGGAFHKGRGLGGWLETAPCPGMQRRRCPGGTGCSGPELGTAEQPDELVSTPPPPLFSSDNKRVEGLGVCVGSFFNFL